MNITNFEITQASIEGFGGVICLMAAVIIILNKPKLDSIRLFVGMFVSAAVIFIAEAGAYIFRGNLDTYSIVMTRVCNFLVFLTNLVLANLFVRYVYSFLREKGVIVRRLYQDIANVIFILAAGILVVNLFTGWMYYFDDSNYYHRNIMWYIYTCLSLLSVFMGAYTGLKHRRRISRLRLFSLVLYAFIPIIAIIIQLFYYGLSIVNIGVGIGIVLMFWVYLMELSKSDVNEADEEKRNIFLEMLLLFVIMIISMGASIISFIWSISRIGEDNSEGNSRVIAHMIGDGIENEFLRPIAVSETMSKDYSLKEYLKRSGEESPEEVEEDIAAYLNSIRTGFGYDMVFAVCDRSKAYYTYNGISKYVHPESDDHDIWYTYFLESQESYDLDVDTDEANNWDLSVFINAEVIGDNGDLLGVCGVGVEMNKLREMIAAIEEEYQVKIDLIDETGLIQIDSDAARIETEYLDNSYLDKVGQSDFYYENLGTHSRLTKYMEELAWYLVVVDNNPDKINLREVITPSVIIFLGGLFMVAAVFSVITVREQKARKELEERRKASITDEVTGMLNRRAFEEECARIKKEGSCGQISVIMMDVNGLKYVNDNYGHAAGDELLISAAHCMQNTFSEFGKVFRIGGDEFVALMTCSRERIEDAVKTFHYLTATWSSSHIKAFTVSIGIAVGAEQQEADLDLLIELADKHMYEDKDEYYERTGKVRREPRNF